MPVLNGLHAGVVSAPESVAHCVTSLRIDVLGGLVVRRAGAPVALPQSRKTRALLAYLALTRRPQRRDRLCELFWDLPDDPRGALRWSLSKLRPILGEHLVADRERVHVEHDSVTIDYAEVQERFDAGQTGASPEELRAAVAVVRQPLLPGLDLPGQDLFQAWLVAERDHAAALHRRLIGRLALSAGVSAHDRLAVCREWFDCDSLNPNAAAALIRALTQLGRSDEAASVTARFRTAATAAGLPAAIPPPQALPPDSVEPVGQTERQLLTRQRVRFCNAPDGVRIAHATVGSGPPLVKAANWLNHLELDWDSPIWAPLFRDLARDRCFIRYDERGNGLSDWDVAELSFEAFVLDLEAVVDALEVERFPLLGISQGCAVAIEYAVRHPHRVSHLILWGGYAAGWRVVGDADLRAEREAHITLVRQGWGRAEPVYRQIFSATFLPGATHAELDWFNAFQRQTVSAGNAARFLEVFADIDVRHRLAQVRAPTLVMHAREDHRVPLRSGVALAAGIPGAEFVALESANHLLLGREPAAGEFVAHVRNFLTGRETRP
jgi:pimeloyl-ACP methyl ester carboxylesterase/DNA-binding SARP family transcriptional activator